MKFSFSWIKEYLVEDISFEEFKNNITRLGFGIDLVEKNGVEAENVFSAQILKIEKHPNADKLSLCEVTTGKEIYKVVCGAKNIYEGQKVPLALVGAKLPEGVIKKAKIRGIESNGMICSAKELGLKGYDETGILELDKDIPLGIDIREIFQKTDYTFELEITPNLAYCLAHYPLARELAIFCGYKLKDIQIPEFKVSNKEVEIKIENPENCPRYVGYVVKNIKNKKTPDYIYQRLKAIGLNPKGDVLIDASNYVMFELGQPTHCFDLNNISGKEINVRQAKDGEIIKTLDNSEQKLSEKILVIADKEKPVAIAGVIGGFYSSINPETKDILIESAIFNPSSVRRTSKLLNISTDSSYRFERGVDSSLQPLAAARIVQIIKELNPDIEITQTSDIYPAPKQNQVIEINYDKINSILGTSLEKEKIDKCLLAMNPSYDGKNFIVPSYRWDIKTIWDISEEVARFIGYDVIESKTSMPVMKVDEDPLYNVAKQLMEKFKAYGFSEVCNYDLVSLKEIKDVLFPVEKSIILKNPLSSDFAYLRPSLLIGLMKNLKYNLNRGQERIAIFEYGKIFFLENEKIIEVPRISGILYGRSEYYWKNINEDYDFYKLKGILNNVLDGIVNFSFDREGEEKIDFFCEGGYLLIKAKNNKIGHFGILNTQISKNYDLKDNNIFYFDLFLDRIVDFYEKDFYKRIGKIKPVSQFQSSWRDISIVIDKKYSWKEVYDELKNIPDVLWIKLIDIYTGKNIPENMKSLTIRFMFSSMTRTFTDQELNSFIEKAFLKLKNKFNASLRT